MNARDDLLIWVDLVKAKNPFKITKIIHHPEATHVTITHNKTGQSYTHAMTGKWQGKLKSGYRPTNMGQFMSEMRKHPRVGKKK